MSNGHFYILIVLFEMVLSPSLQVPSITVKGSLMIRNLRDEAERILAPYKTVPGAVERIVAAYNEP